MVFGVHLPFRRKGIHKGDYQFRVLMFHGSQGVQWWKERWQKEELWFQSQWDQECDKRGQIVEVSDYYQLCPLSLSHTQALSFPPLNHTDTYLEICLKDLELFLGECGTNALRFTRLQGGTGAGIIATAVVTVT